MATRPAAPAKFRTDWYVVPHGFAPTNPQLLCCGLRAMPVLRASGEPDSESIAPLRDWPQYVMSVNAARFGQQTGAPQVDVGTAYATQLADCRITLAQATQLWKAIFGEVVAELLTCDERALDRYAVPRRNSRQQPKPTQLHNSAQLAVATRSHVANVFADSLLQSSAFAGKAALGIARVAHGRVSATPPMPQGLLRLRQAAALYASPKKPMLRYDDLKKQLAAQQYASVRSGSWADDVLKSRAQGDPGGGRGPRVARPGDVSLPDPAFLPHSATHIMYLLSLGSGGFLPGSNAAPGDEFGLDDFSTRLAERRLAYAGTPQSQQSQHQRQPNDPSTRTAADAADEFHQRLVGLASHAWLLRILGLVVDVEIDLGAHANDVTEIGVTQIDTPEGSRIVGVPLRTQLSEGFARAAYDPGPKKRPAYHGGLLNVSSEGGAFELTQIDVDRTPERYVQAAVSFESQLQAGQVASKIATELQAQETIGIALIEVGGDRKAAALTPDDSADAETQGKLYLEHLLAGYRPDVQPEIPRATGGSQRLRWRSMTSRRIRSVRLAGKDVTDWFDGVGPIEAFLSERTRTVQTGSDTQALLEGELFCWTASGICAGARTDASTTDLTVSDASDKPLAAGRLKIEYDTPEIALQRFGRRYRFGVRLAMVDGRSVDVDAAAQIYEDQQAGPVVTIGDDTWSGIDDAPRLRHMQLDRFEQISPPSVLLVDPPERRRFAKQAARHVVVSTGRSARFTLHEAERIIVPPRAANPDLHLRDGAFDGVPGNTDWPASAFPGVMLTPAGSFPAESYAFTGVDKSTGTTEDLYYRRMITPPDHAPYYPDPWARRALLGFYRQGDDCLLGADFFDYYDEPNGRHWPNCRALHLRVRTAETVRNRDIGFDVEHRDDGLTVHLLPGVHLVVRIWHEIDETRIGRSGIVEQLAQLALGNDGIGASMRASIGLSDSPMPTIDDVRAALRTKLAKTETLCRWITETPRPADERSALVNLTSYWMLNPYVELTVVHAVDIPLAPLALADRIPGGAAEQARAFAPLQTSDAALPFAIVRAVGATKASFCGHLRLDRMTAARVDATAHWIDNPPTAAPTGRGRRHVATPRAVSRPLFALKDIAAVAVDDGGSPPLQPQPTELTIAQQSLQCMSAWIAVRSDDHADTTPAVADFDFGDTHARVIDVVLSAVSRDAGEYTAASASDTVRVAPGQRVVVRSSARPLAPLVDYVAPLMHWSQGRSPTGDPVSTRDAGWFRIWLGTDWYSSGNGELLALVCWPGDVLAAGRTSARAVTNRALPSDYAEPDPLIERFVTRWGLDPIVQEDIDFANMPASALRNRLLTREDVAASGGPAAQLDVDLHHLQDMHDYEPRVDLALLPEVAKPAPDAMRNKKAAPSATLAQLALYRPLLDERSGRMFVDIQLDPLVAYQPFVRLALARYQPYSVEAAGQESRLSPIVTAEFIQLLPERSASLCVRRGQEAGLCNVHVALTGTALKDGSDSGSPRTRFLATLEERHGDLAETSYDSDAGINGAWIPTDPVCENKPLSLSAGDNVWQTDLSLRSRVGHSYSVRIEEYEMMPGDADPVDGRLVYFDRLMINEP